MPLRHLLDVHLRHVVVLLHVLVPRGVEVGVLHIVSDLNLGSFVDLAGSDGLLLAFLLLSSKGFDLGVGPTRLQVVALKKLGEVG